MEPLIVTVEHLHTVPNWNAGAGYCSRGTRLWMARHGLDWTEFVTQGLPASAFIATGDAMALRLVEHAREVMGRG